MTPPEFLVNLNLAVRNYDHIHKPFIQNRLQLMFSFTCEVNEKKGQVRVSFRCSDAGDYWRNDWGRT